MAVPSSTHTLATKSMALALGLVLTIMTSFTHDAVAASGGATGGGFSSRGGSRSSSSSYRSRDPYYARSSSTYVYREYRGGCCGYRQNYTPPLQNGMQEKYMEGFVYATIAISAILFVVFIVVIYLDKNGAKTSVLKLQVALKSTACSLQRDLNDIALNDNCYGHKKFRKYHRPAMKYFDSLKDLIPQEFSINLLFRGPQPSLLTIEEQIVTGIVQPVMGQTQTVVTSKQQPQLEDPIDTVADMRLQIPDEAEDGLSKLGLGHFSNQVRFESAVGVALCPNQSHPIWRLILFATFNLVNAAMVGVLFLPGNLEGIHTTYLRVMVIMTIGVPITVAAITFLVTCWLKSNPNGRSNWITGLSVANRVANVCVFVGLHLIQTDGAIELQTGLSVPNVSLSVLQLFMGHFNGDLECDL